MGLCVYAFMVCLVLVAWFELSRTCVIAGTVVEGVVSGWALVSGLQRGGCGVGWKERCGENVLIAPPCCVQALDWQCSGILIDVWKGSFWLPIHAV